MHSPLLVLWEHKVYNPEAQEGLRAGMENCLTQGLTGLWHRTGLDPVPYPLDYDARHGAQL